MRIFICTLILTILFGGYSSAAHAFGEVSCHPQDVLELSASDADMAGCADHNQADQGHADHSKTGKGQCMDCTHCCAFHVAGLLDYSVSYPPQATLHHAVPADGYSDYFSFSLLRPPKTLV